MAIEQMTYEEAQEVLRKARNKIKPGEFISNRTPPIKQNRADADGPGFPSPLFRTGNLVDGELRTSRPSGDRVKDAPMPNPTAAYEKWLADQAKQNGAHSREDLDATYPLDADDPCAKHCDAVADAALSAQFAKSADDREAHLSKALECIDAACRAHEALKKGQKS